MTLNNSLQNEINLREVESAAGFSRCVSNESVLYERKEIKKQPKQEQEQLSDINDEVDVMDLRDTFTIERKSIPIIHLRILQFLTAFYRTMVYGCSNSGKSFIAIAIALAVALARNVFFLKASEPSSVVYIDGELDSDVKARIKQMCDASYLEHILKNLCVIKARGKNFRNELFRNRVIEKIRGFKPRLVIIDNIISLFPDSVNRNMDTLNNFVQYIESIGAAILFIHHTEKSGTTYKGPMEFEGLCQNIVHLRGRHQIKQDFKKEKLDLPEPLYTAINSKQNGPVVSVHVDKCKVCPELEHNTYYYCLPIDGQWEEINVDKVSASFDAEELEDTADEDENDDGIKSEDADLDETDSVATGSEDDTEDSPSTMPTDTQELTEDEQAVLEAAAKPGGIRNRDVATLLSCSESKASSLLSRLTKRGVLERQGAGPATHYVPA